MKRLMIFAALLCCMITPALAQSPQSYETQVDELLEEARQYGVDPEQGLEAGVGQAFSQAGKTLDGMLRGGLRTAIRILVIVLFCAIATSADVGQVSQSLQVIRMAGALAITALSVGEINTMIGLGRESIRQMDTFAGALLPVMATLTALTGQTTAAAARSGVTILFSDLMITLIDRLLMPMVYGYIAACCAHAALGNEGMKKIAGLFKSLVSGALTVFMLIYVAYLSISGAITGSADAAMVKAAKLAMSKAVPVVGSILSDAAETVLAGAGVLKGTVGLAGLLVVLVICLGPFIQLGIHYLTYKLVAALAGTVADPKLTALIDSISGAFGLVLGMTASCALILMVSLISAISAVVT